MPVVTSILWLYHNEPPSIQLISASNLLLDIKFLLFLRAFKYFGVYFAIILGVARKVFSFLMILFTIILSFAHAFYILLKPTSKEYTLDQPNLDKNDQNNPWNLAPKYYTYFAGNNSINYDSFLLQLPDSNTNIFAKFDYSMLAMYKFLTGI